MGYTARTSLPGYDCLTDTNLDHYSLYADVDNVLIKRQSTGTASIATAGTAGFTTQTFNHNLGYIPFYVAYGNINNTGRYQILNNQFNPFSPPDAISSADGTNINITNFDATTLPVAYDIFYDDMSQTGTPSITQSQYAFKVTRPGKDISSTNPNDYILHSDLNNFKILKSGTSAQTLGTGSLFAGTTTFAHGAAVDAPYKYFCYVKFPDGKTTLTGLAGAKSYDESKGMITSYIDGTNIGILNFGTTNIASSVSYYVYGSGRGTTITNGYEIACTKAGKDVLTANNPDDFNFHSSYPTLKYYTSGTYVMSNINTTTYATISHNLGYTPFFVGFVNDLAGFFGNNNYAIMPYNWGRSTIPAPNKDIGAYIYADSTNIYLKAYFQASAGTTKTFTFYYKVFKNNLGL